jgi:hypothetical protein
MHQFFAPEARAGGSPGPASLHGGDQGATRARYSQATVAAASAVISATS